MSPERIEELVSIALSWIGEEDESIRKVLITAINETKEEDAEIAITRYSKFAHYPKALSEAILSSKIKE